MFVKYNVNVVKNTEANKIHASEEGYCYLPKLLRNTGTTTKCRNYQNYYFSNESVKNNKVTICRDIK